ncbi:M15 family metallopeptidase [Paenibacillus graminis]|uniref:M15 family metallopeptidase n=1 Tax=Paenibacillus graminis TaxID=189425 RepID=UPI0004B1FFA0
MITQGLRTIAKQDALYAQGRTKPGPIVTNARGGHSYHNYGLAIDFALLQPDGRNVSWDMNRDGNGDRVADWKGVVQQAKALGFEWGGDWTSIKDYPHFQMTFGLVLSALRSGAKPTAAQVKAAYAVIDKLQGEAEEDMSKIEVLETQIKELAEVVAGLTNSKDALKGQVLQQAGEIKELGRAILELTDTTPPKWSLEAIQALHDTPSVFNGNPVIDTPDKATKTEARIFTVLYRLDLARLKGD